MLPDAESSARRLRSDPMNLAGHARWRESVISTAFSVPKQRPRTVVIGAGVIGLGIAWRLAQAGCAVTVYDRGEAGRGASWAAAGMLAAAVETEPGEEPLLPLALESQRLWPDFARELEAASGVSVDYRGEGTMVVALNRDDAAQLRHSYEFQKGLGPRSEWLTAAQAREREPHLKPGHRRRRVEPARPSGREPPARPRLGGGGAQGRGRTGRALPGARDHGRGRPRRRRRDRARPRPGRYRRAGGRRLVARDRRHPAGASARRCGRSRARCWRLQMDPAAPLLRHVLWLPRGYLVPRHDGRLVDRRHGRGARLRRAADRRRAAGADRGRLARRADDRGIADRRDLGRVPPGLARRRADAGSERHRPAGRRHRPSPQRHSVDPGHAPRWSAPIS